MAVDIPLSWAVWGPEADLRQRREREVLDRGMDRRVIDGWMIGRWKMDKWMDGRMTDGGWMDGLIDGG